MSSEPLGAANNDSLPFPSTAPLHLPLSSQVLESTRQNQGHDFGQLMRDVTAPLKLSLVLENKGNVARDHLASERTYLAYVRTSLACASAGVALVQLFTMGVAQNTSPQHSANLNQFAKPIGAMTVLTGLIILVFGLIRYFTTQSALVRGYYPVARNSITAIAFILGSLVAIVFSIIIAKTQ